MKEAREKREIKYKGTSIRLLVDFSTETFQVRRERKYIFKIFLKVQNNLSTKNPIEGKAILPNQRRDKDFPEGTDRSCESSSVLALQEMLEDIMLTETSHKGKYNYIASY